MRKVLLYVVAVCLIMLAACGESDEQAANPDVDNTEVEKQENNESEKVTGESEEDATEQQEESRKEEAGNEEENSVSGVKGIFLKAAEAASTIEGMRITGEVISTTDMMGQVTEEHSQINGEISIDPFVEYLTIDLQSTFGGVTENSSLEMYLTSEGMYMTDTALNQWLLLPMNQGFGDLSSIMTDSHYSHFAKFHDSFELREDNDHYILTLTGSGDTFKEIIFGAMKDLIGEEGYQAITNLVKDLSGTYELVFDKQTFHLVALNMDWEQTIDFGMGETRISEQSKYQYGDFNKINPVVVPESVLNNAQSIYDLSTGEGNE